MATNGGGAFSSAFDRTYSLGLEGNDAYAGRDVLRGLIDGIDAFIECQQPRWRQFRSLGPVLLGCSFGLDDDELLAALERLSGACVVISKLDRGPHRRVNLRRLAALNERTPGLPMRAFRELADLAPLEGGRPALVGPYGPTAGTGYVSTVRALGFRRTDERKWPPLVHPKLALLGHLWWHDEDPLGGVDDYIGFRPYRLWVSSGNFTRGSRRSVEFAHWSEEPALLKAARDFLLELVSYSEPVDPDADDWEPEMAPVDYDEAAMIEAIQEQRYGALEWEAQAEDASD